MKSLLVPLLAVLLSLPASAGFAELVKEGDAHDRKFECDQALESYLPAARLQPGNADLLVKISRQYALRMSDLSKDADKVKSGRTALEYAERAIAAAPNACDPNLSAAICWGKLTPFLGNRESIEATKKIKDYTDRALRADPKSDLGWQILGRWHQSLANLGFATRALAKMIYGGLPAASNDEAVKCFRKAMALDSKRLVHVVELGRTYQMMGRDAEARKYLEQGLAMPNRDKDDPETKLRARKSLKEL